MSARALGSAAVVDLGELRARVGGREWYHTIELAPGVITPGWFDTRPVARRLPIPADLGAHRCLDIGTFDGFWAFEMERRGGAVTAIDILDDRRWDWPATRTLATGTRSSGARASVVGS